MCPLWGFATQDGDRPLTTRTASILAVMPRTHCVHHWKIATPDGEYSEGVCLTCGATKLFCNVPKLTHYEANQGAWRPVVAK